jgi:adenylate cyclase
MFFKKFWSNLLVSEKKQKIFVIITGFIISSIMVIVTTTNVIDNSKLSYYIYDLYTSAIPDTDTSKSLVIIDIDERSLMEVGQWPWPRYKMAYLLLQLKRAGAASVGIDIIFSEPDRTSINQIIKNYKEDFNITFDIEEIPSNLKNNDEILSDVLKNGPFVLSNFIFFNKRNVTKQCDYLTTLTIKNNYSLPHILEGKSFLCNIPALASSVKYKGFFNAKFDSDGMIRRLPLIAKYKNKIYPGLALATILNLFQTKEIEIKNNINSNYIVIKGIKIPVDNYGQVLLNVKGQQKYYKYISAIDLINGNFEKKDIQGKLVFIGSTAVGLNDLHNVAGNIYFPGVEVHATLADNILNNDFFIIPHWAKLFEMFSIILFGLILSYILSLKKLSINIFVLFSTIIIVITGAYYLLFLTHLYISPINTVISLFFIFTVILSINYVIEMKKSLLWANMLGRVHEATIESMATVAETRDPETGAHVLRTQNYVKTLAEALSKKEKYKQILTPNFIEILYKSAAMHDIGKVGIPDRILLKNGKLTEDEFEIMKKHTEYGKNIILCAQRKIPENTFFKTAIEIAYCHHEKWDGSGYPQGLKGEEIPLAGRLMAIADVYDALISKRSYKEAFPHEDACKFINKERGKHFDPDIVDAFRETCEKFKNIAKEYSDNAI